MTILTVAEILAFRAVAQKLTILTIVSKVLTPLAKGMLYTTSLLCITFVLYLISRRVRTDRDRKYFCGSLLKVKVF